MSIFFGIPTGKITVIAPKLGGGFGGKAGIQLEGLAYLLSKSVGGRPVRVANSREEDMLSSPGRMGLQATIKLGATHDGTLTAADLLYLFDSGAYADYAVNISRAAAIACTGPYRIPHVRCDSLCVYTNHPFATAFRGFGHVELCFAIERALDLLAQKLNIDPVQLRAKNAIQQGDTTPTDIILDENTGDLAQCIRRAANMIAWQDGSRIQISETKVRAKGIGCLWKAPAIPPNTDAGAILTFNEDGSLNLHCGIIEIGAGTHTGLAQIVAERFQMTPDMVHVVPEVMTDRSPHDWATAASRSLFMAGRAALEAADDAIRQITQIASIPLRVTADDLEVAHGRVFLPDEPDIGLPLRDVVLGYSYPNGNAIVGQVIGRGHYIARRLSGIDPDTGEGHPALEWTLGAQAFEVEVDITDGSYSVLKAVCCMDVGKVMNPQLARGQITGGMGMGIGFTTSEAFLFDGRELATNGVLRDFKIPRFGEDPEYEVEFLETPQRDGPHGLRGLGEQGIVGTPGALANAFSRAAGVPLNHLPLTPETIWKTIKGGGNA
jgi:CO/xanthine dehydrogenase Mo-binding subunit